MPSASYKFMKWICTLFKKKLHLPNPNILQLLACESVAYMVSFVLLLLQCFEDVLKNLKNVLS